MKAITVLLSIFFLMIFSSCNKCNNENPTARVVNNGTSSANLEITASDGELVSITDLGAGLISSSESYSPGTTTVNCIIDGIQLTEKVEMSECKSYDITINSENVIVVFSTKID